MIVRDKYQDISDHLKHNGFIIPNAEIYGGLAKSWDFGPNGAEVKRKLKDLWWKYFVVSNSYNVGCDSAILTHSKVLEASGHLRNFHDWLVECLSCQKRYRLDKIIPSESFVTFLRLANKKKFLLANNKCESCQQSNFANPRKFNLLLSTDLQIVTKKKNEENLVYLRPETCQSIFVNFLLIQQATRRRLPFGVGQIGKSFRNEITLHHGIFRTREFEQMELEFFCEANKSEEWWNYWTKKAWNFLQNIVNNQTRIKKVDVETKELPHYSRKTLDLYFNYHFGWGEICSNSHRGSYDLTKHSECSQKNLSIDGTIPEVVEVSFGVERLILAVLEDAYVEETIEASQLPRKVLKLHPLLSPYFAAVVPLPANKDVKKNIQEKAFEVYLSLLKEPAFTVTYEETDSIGKSYRRQDAIGTYYCLTVDFQTLEDETITVRERDSMLQKRVDLNNLTEFLNQKYCNHYQKFI